MDTYLDLARRCEEAQGPDRELDALIWAELDGRDVREDGDKILAKSRRPPHDECLLGWIDPGKKSRNFSPASAGHVAPLSSSLDAAVSFCERQFGPRVVKLVEEAFVRWAASDKPKSESFCRFVVDATLRAVAGREG